VDYVRASGEGEGGVSDSSLVLKTMSELRALMAVVEARLNADADTPEQWTQIAKTLEQAARKARKMIK